MDMLALACKIEW